MGAERVRPDVWDHESSYIEGFFSGGGGGLVFVDGLWKFRPWLMAAGLLEAEVIEYGAASFTFTKAKQWASYKIHIKGLYGVAVAHPDPPSGYSGEGSGGYLLWLEYSVDNAASWHDFPTFNNASGVWIPFPSSSTPLDYETDYIEGDPPLADIIIRAQVSSNSSISTRGCAVYLYMEDMYVESNEDMMAFFLTRNSALKPTDPTPRHCKWGY
jgi:hypothetical protein